MSEIERLQSEGFVTESFLREESRSNYIVSSKLKKIWAVELDLLREFDRVCKKHNLKYMAIGGTLLGTVRHKGFIPWDDDIDLAMFREDFDKLREIAPNEFVHPFYFQSPYVSVNERAFLSDMYRLRNSETTAIDSIQQKYAPKSNQGVFIDIFPLDNVPDDDKLKCNQLRRIKEYHNFNKFCFFCTKSHLWKHPNPIIRNSRNIISLLFNKPMKALSNIFFEKYVKECVKYKGEKTQRVGLLMFILNAEKLIFKREDCQNLIDAPFEFISMPIGSGFDSMLSHQYGDWHKLVQGTAYHSLDVMNADIPYKDYRNQQ